MPRSTDPGLDAELDEIARRLRAELGGERLPRSQPPVAVRREQPSTRPRSQASVARFFVAAVVPGLILIGVTLAMGLNG